ncbi:MAG: hypothetical protein ACJ8FY_15495 [Gemmataceae bacterium]
MTSRERTMAIALGTLVVVGGGAFAFDKFFLSPLRELHSKRDQLEDKAYDKSTKRQQILADMPRLDRWKQLSLPSDVELARREYQSYLEKLTRDSGIPGRNVTVTARAAERATDLRNAPGQTAKTPVYTKLAFNVNVRSNFANLVKLLEGFYKTSLLHQIKTLSIQRAANTGNEKTTDLETTMTVEALVVTGAGNRLYLLPNMDRRLLILEAVAGMKHVPQGLALAGWAITPTGPLGPGLLAHAERDYKALASRDIFHGPEAVVEQLGKPEWIAPRSTKLTDITRSDRHTEGSLFDFGSKRKYRLRASAGFDSFPFVKDGQGKTVVRGSVVRIDLDNRDIIVRVAVSSYEPSPGDQSESIFRLSEKDRENLIRTGALKSQEADPGFRLSEKYWQTLLKSQVIKPDEEGDGFAIETAAQWGGPVVDENDRVEVLRGKVLRKQDDRVYITLKEKYCALHVGQTVEDSLNKPLPQSQVKEIKSARAAP